eukprot:COSAG06_NODE_1102_length_10694_cov_5.964417_5_plen_91_part_00
MRQEARRAGGATAALNAAAADRDNGMGRGLGGGDVKLEAADDGGGGGGVVECHNSPNPAEVDVAAKQPLAVRCYCTTAVCTAQPPPGMLC